MGLDKHSTGIIETTHPFERTNSPNFPLISFPESIALAVYFDKQSNFEPNGDVLTITSSYE